MKRGRLEVAAFARRMLYTLCTSKNECKPGWKQMSMEKLEAKLDEEYQELKDDILSYLLYTRPPYVPNPKYLEERRRRIAMEATDLANVAMMITDVVGGLDE